MMKMLALSISVMLFLSSCNATTSSRLCTTVYCDPELEGASLAYIESEYGEPDKIETFGNEEVWTYDVRSFWKFGTQGTLKITAEEGIVTDAQYFPPYYREVEEVPRGTAIHG